MKPIVRHVLRVVAILTFFVIAPFLVLYAFGYRFTLEERGFQQVGLMVVETDPRSATVFLKGEEVATRTPYRATSLTPGDYAIRVEREGYHSWEKSLFVESTLATWVSNIVLFLEQGEQTPLLEGNVTHAASTDTGVIGMLVETSTEEDATTRAVYFLYPTSKELRQVPMTEAQAETLQRLTSESIALRTTGSVGNPGLLVTGTDDKNVQQTFLITEQHVEILSKDRLVAGGAPFGATISTTDELFLDTRGRPEFYYTDEGILNTYDMSSEEIGIVSTQSSVRGFGANSHAYAFLDEEDNIFVAAPQLLGRFIEEPTYVDQLDETIASDASLHIYPGPRGQEHDVVLLHTTEALSAFEAETGDIHPIANSVRSFVGAHKLPLIAYETGSEVGFVSFEDVLPELSNTQLVDIPAYEPQAPTTLARYSEPIQALAWHPTDHHVAIRLETRVVIIELDGRDTRNTAEWDVPALEGVAPFLTFSTNGNKLYTSTSDGIIEIQIAE